MAHNVFYPQLNGSIQCNNSNFCDNVYIYLHVYFSSSSFAQQFVFINVVSTSTFYSADNFFEKTVWQQIPGSFYQYRWQLAGPCAVVIVGDGWDLQFPLPDNVSCCETMRQKISTAVMAQQCSLPLYILLQELIQSLPQMYCM